MLDDLRLLLTIGAKVQREKQNFEKIYSLPPMFQVVPPAIPLPTFVLPPHPAGLFL
jgi:hypothetical protein